MLARTAERADATEIQFKGVMSAYFSIVSFWYLAYLRQFEHFGAAKYLSLLEPTPEGRHYNEFGAGGAAVILGGGWTGSSSFNLFSNRLSSGSGSV